MYSPDFLDSPAIVITGIPTDVRHENAHTRALPLKIPRQVHPKFGSVNVPVNRANRLKPPQPIEHFRRAEIAGVPHLIALGEMVKYSFIQEAVGI